MDLTCQVALFKRCTPICCKAFVIVTLEKTEQMEPNAEQVEPNTVVGFLNLVAIVASWSIFYSRSGLASVRASKGISWRELFLPNISWFLLTWLKCIFWHAVLVLWLVRGCPSSPWQARTEIDGKPVRRIIRVSRAAERSVGT